MCMNTRFSDLITATAYSKVNLMLEGSCYLLLHNTNDMMTMHFEGNLTFTSREDDELAQALPKGLDQLQQLFSQLHSR